MSLLGTCFTFPPVQACTLYFYREVIFFSDGTLTYAFGRVPSSAGVPAAGDGSTSGYYLKAAGTDWDSNAVTYQLTSPEMIPSGEDTIFTAGGETEGWFYYDPGGTPNPDGNNCGTGFTYSNELRLNDLVDDCTGAFPGASFTGLGAGQARLYHFNDFPIGLGFGVSRTCGTIQLSAFTFGGYDGSMFLYCSSLSSDGAPNTAIEACSSTFVPNKLAVDAFNPVTGLPYVVAGVAASWAAFVDPGGLPSRNVGALLFTIGRALAINDKYVLVTWVMMADGTTFIRPSCVAYPTPGGADVVIPTPDLKTLASVAGDLFPANANASVTPISAQPIGLLTKILVGYDCTTWNAAGQPF
jgi:hypothetical protein